MPQKCAVRELWRKEDLGNLEGRQVFKVAPHGSALYRLSPSPGP